MHETFKFNINKNRTINSLNYIYISLLHYQKPKVVYLWYRFDNKRSLFQQNSIGETETRAAELEEYADYLLRDVFRHFVCSEQVLYLRVFVEDTYESCVGPNDANLDSFSMMKWIERIHEELNLQLDNLPREIVRRCEREGFRQETKAIKEAEDAARKVRSFLVNPKPTERSR